MFQHKSIVVAAIWALGLAAVAISLVGAPAGSAGAQTSTSDGQGSFAGVSFNYDRSLATTVEGRTVASSVGQDTIAYEIRPEHTNFVFTGYPVQGVWSPQIRVIPAAAYQSAQPLVMAPLSDLRKSLASRQTDTALPLLPLVNATRVISENMAFVPFNGGSGVRFIASYSQGPAPVGEDNITYVYAGLTSDGKYYVEGTFPVSISALDPTPSPITTENAQAYNQALAERLRNTGASGFTPALDKLDAMMASLQINAPTVPGMPSTGAGTPLNRDLLAVLVWCAGLVVVSGLVILARDRVQSRL